MKVVAIIQARVASTRLPAKIFLDLYGVPALQRCLERVRRFQGIDDVLIATTQEPEDDLVVAFAKRMDVRVTRGSVSDVLSRYVEGARTLAADAVVRCTSDCPLLDPTRSSEVIDTFLRAHARGEPIDYAANNLDRRLPRGLDTEIVAMSALQRAARDATSASEREHVTLHVYRRPETFRLAAVTPANTPDLSSHRWTLDTLDDYRFLSGVFDALGARAATASMEDVLALLEARPELRGINAHIQQKEVAP